MKKKISLKDKINDSNYKNKTIEEIININRKYIFELIKKGYDFDDEVLMKCNIKKTIKNQTVKLEIAEHQKDDKVYEKETESLKNIIKSLLIIDNQNITYEDVEIEYDNKTENCNEFEE